MVYLLDKFEVVYFVVLVNVDGMKIRVLFDIGVGSLYVFV